MLNKKVIIWPVLALLMCFCMTADAQRRVKLNRGLERFKIASVAQDSGFITSDANGKALWVTRDSTLAILGPAATDHFFNTSLTQTQSSIKHISISGAIEVEGPAAWMFDGSTSWEVDSWAGDVGGRINVDDGTGLVFQGMDTKMEMRANQIFLETDNTFFQLSDFGSPGRMVFRADDYRFSDGVGGQYPDVDNTLDSVVVLDAAGFMHVRGVSTLPNTQSLDTIDEGERIIGHFGLNGASKTLYQQDFYVGDTSVDFDTGLKQPGDSGLTIIDINIVGIITSAQGENDGAMYGHNHSNTPDQRSFYWSGSAGSAKLMIEMNMLDVNSFAEAYVTIKYFR